jgi:hypothetical protein
MSFIQKVLSKLMPGSFEQMRAESKRWMIKCTGCDYQVSVWDAGGIRSGASSKGKSTKIKCPKCGTLKTAKIELASE